MGSTLWDVRSSVHVLHYLRHVAVVDGRHSDQLRLDVEACAIRAHGTSLDRPRSVGRAAWLVDACVFCSQDCQQQGRASLAAHMLGDGRGWACDLTPSVPDSWGDWW